MLPRSPFPVFRLQREALFLACSLLLGACSHQGEPSSIFAAPAAQVSGEILFPPAPGKVLLQADAGGAAFGLVQFAVRQDGQYAVTLPAPAHLPAAGNTGILPLLPDIQLLGFASGSCASRPVPSVPEARVVLVRRGQFEAGGRVLGQLLPAAQATGSGGPQDGLRLEVRQYAYADRDVQVSGVLECAYQTAVGQALPATIRVNYRLQRGWNVLNSETTVTATQATTTLSAQSASASVQWRYWPAPANLPKPE